MVDSRRIVRFLAELIACFCIVGQGGQARLCMI